MDEETDLKEVLWYIEGPTAILRWRGGKEPKYVVIYLTDLETRSLDV